MEIVHSTTNWYLKNGYSLPNVRVIGDDLAEWTREKKVSHSVTFSDNTLTVYIVNDAERMSLTNMLRDLPKATYIDWSTEKGMFDDNESITYMNYRWYDERTKTSFRLMVLDYTLDLQ